MADLFEQHNTLAASTQIDFGWKFWMRSLLVAGMLVASTAMLEQSAAQSPAKVANRANSATSSESHKLAPAIRIARASLAAMDKVTDYDVVFSKREIVGSALIAQSMRLKFRKEPFSVYIRYNSPSPGREAIYVQGKYDGKILAHGTGIEAIAGTLALDPNGARALEESRYPITMIGAAKMLETVIGQWEAEMKHSEGEVKYYPNAKVGDAECKVIESTYPTPNEKLKFHITRLYFDKTTNLPVRVEQFGFPSRGMTQPPLIEEYTYHQLKPNVGLTDADFDPRNPAYDY